MALTADDLNYLVYRYLQESGFVHAAFAFRNEADLSRLDLVQDYYLPGILVRLVQRGLQYMELEANVYRDDGSSADPPKFEVLTAADILRAKSPAALKGLVQDRREASTTTSATRVFPEAREAAACGAELDADVDAVFAACWNPEGTRLACYTQGVQCSIWEVGPCGGDPGKGAGEPRRIVLRRGGSSVGASAPLVWSPDGLQVGMGLDDGWVCIWDPEGQCLQELSGHAVAGRAPGDNAVLDLAFSPDSSKLLTASGNGSVILWGCASGKELLRLASHSTAAEAVAWRGDGGVFASSSWEGEIHVFRLEGGGSAEDEGGLRAVKIRELKGHSVGVDKLLWAPNQWLLASYSEKYVKLWSIHQSSYLCELLADGRNDEATQSSCLCDLIDDDRDEESAQPWQSHSDCVLSIAFRPAGPGSRNPGLPLQIATTGEDGRAKIWDCESGALLHTLVHRDSTVLSCDWSGDGLTLVTGHADGSVTLWDAQAGCVRQLYTAKAGVLHVCWSPDGVRLAASTKAGTVFVIDTRLPS